MSFTLIKKVSEFKKAFFYGPVVNIAGEVKPGPDNIMWSWQHFPDNPDPKTGRREITYWPSKPLRELRDEDLIAHFEQKPRKMTGSIRGSLGSVGKFKDNKANWFALDCDNQKAVDIVRSKLLCILEDYSIDYIWECSGDDIEEKAHIWFMCDAVDVSLLSDYVLQIFEDSGINPFDRSLAFELYPTTKGNNVIRLPGGIHLKTRKVNPLIYKEICSSSADFILDTFITSRKETEEKIKSVLRPKQEKSKKEEPRNKRNSKFFYNSLNLPLPVADLPPVLRKVASNCQAINKVIQDCVDNKDKEDNLINDQTGAGHSAGKWLWNLALYNDIRANFNRNIKSTEGEQWIKNFCETYRVRDYAGHNWDKDREALFANPERFFPKCETWSNTFNYCDGCKFKDRPGFKSPRQIWQGFPIKKIKLADVKLVSPDEVRKDTFQRVKQRVFQCVENNISKDILLASPLGTGKSWAIDEMASELASQGKSVLIAAPTADLAIQHKKWCEANGQQAFVIMSHEKLFEKLNPGFDCPKDVEIKHLYKLGISSGVWKNSFCKKCPYAEECPYPNQYRDIGFGNNNIIIIQHAHFTCRETLFSIMQKKYDVMFIDEAFIDSCHRVLKPKQTEIEVLDTFRAEIPWAGPICDWLDRGEYAKKEGDKTLLRPTETQLEHVKYKMDEMFVPWNIPDYLRYYNINMYFDKNQGFQIFYPLPESPYVTVRVFTDATPPIEYLKTVLDNPNIEVFGDDEVLDYRKLNKENKLIQVLDSSMSKASLKGPPDENGEFEYIRFCEILEFIADKAKTEYKGQKLLITTYADGQYDKFKSVAKKYFEANCPELDVGFDPPSQICISHMMIGTNKFEDYLVQFLIAGVYHNGKKFKDAIFKYRSITNFWNRLKDRPIEPNMFPYGVGNSATIPREEEPVRRILPINNKAAVFTYPDFTYRKPANPDYNIIERFAIAKTQQAIRLRFNDDRKRVVYVFGNYFLPSFLVTESVVEDEILGYLRSPDSVRIVD